MYVMLALNLLGAAAHCVGVVLTATQGRWDIALVTYRTEPVNVGTVTQVQLTRIVRNVGYVYPTQIVFLFFALSLGFHTLISVVLILSLCFPGSALTTWYMRGLYVGVAPWVRCSNQNPLMWPIRCLLHILAHARCRDLVLPPEWPNVLQPVQRIYGWQLRPFRLVGKAAQNLQVILVHHPRHVFIGKDCGILKLTGVVPLPLVPVHRNDMVNLRVQQHCVDVLVRRHKLACPLAHISRVLETGVLGHRL